MPRKPPHAGFVNLHGQPLSLQDLMNDARRSRGAPGGPAPDAAAPLHEDDVATVLDALCLAGVPKGRTWLLHWLRAVGWRAHGGARALTADEVGRALHQLAERGQAHLGDTQG